jgi:hypothetical protein
MELIDWWGNLQSSLQNGLLPLETDILWPTDETAQITLGLDALTDLKATGTRYEQGVLDSLDLSLLDSQRGGCDLLSLLQKKPDL